MVKAGVPLSICGNSKQAENRQLRTTVLILSHTRTWALMSTYVMCRMTYARLRRGSLSKPSYSHTRGWRCLCLQVKSER